MGIVLANLVVDGAILVERPPLGAIASKNAAVGRGRAVWEPIPTLTLPLKGREPAAKVDEKGMKGGRR